MFSYNLQALQLLVKTQNRIRNKFLFIEHNLFYAMT